MNKYWEIVKDKCQNTKILGIIGVVLIIISTFFKYVVVSIFGIKEGVSLAGYWEGKVLIFLGLVGLATIFSDFITEKVPANIASKITFFKNQKMIWVLVALGILLVLITNSSVFTSSITKAGFGAILVWIGFVVTAAYPIIYKGDKNITEIKNEEK